MFYVVVLIWSCHTHGHLLQCVQTLGESKTLQIYLFNFLFILLFSYLICMWRIVNIFFCVHLCEVKGHMSMCMHVCGDQRLVLSVFILCLSSEHWTGTYQALSVVTRILSQDPVFMGQGLYQQS